MAIRLLLYEQPIYRNRTDIGKVDLVFLARNKQILLVETKYIDFNRTGRTAKTKRTKNRNKVIEQSLRLRESLHHYHGIPKRSIICGIFTNDGNLQVHPSLKILVRSVEHRDFLKWLEGNRHEKW
jgi:hypothetical protein